MVGYQKEQLERALKSDRIIVIGNSLRHMRYLDESSLTAIGNLWDGFLGQNAPVYVVQTNTDIVQRCLLMTTDPGDLVLDPTCGSGTAAYVAEQWGRRWITIDTSRVALALARARIMGARYPYYLLADSRDGQLKEAEIVRKAPSEASTYNDIRQGFVYERVPHITLKSIANNAEIDVIWERFQETLEPLRRELNDMLGTSYEEWEIPRDADETWPEKIRRIHEDWWDQRIARQKEIDASIAAKADYEYLYDKPYEDNKKVRVAGPFTVESLSPHRLLGVDENDELIDNIAEAKLGYGEKQDFAAMILEHLKTSGVQQAHKEDKITLTSVTPWPGELICAEARIVESDKGQVESGGKGGELATHHWRSPCSDFHRPGIRHRLPPRPRASGPRGCGRRLRCPAGLRLQLRSPRLGVQQTRPCPGPQGAYERRPAHGRRPQKHRQGQPVRHIRRTGYYSGE